MTGICRTRGPYGRGVLPAMLLVIAGCVATEPSELRPEFVSPDDYAPLDCAEIERELRFVDARTRELFERLERRRHTDFWQAGAVLFTLGASALYLDGDGPEADEFRRFRGESEALRIAALNKDCRLDAPLPSGREAGG